MQPDPVHRSVGMSRRGVGLAVALMSLGTLQSCATTDQTGSSWSQVMDRSGELFSAGEFDEATSTAREALAIAREDGDEEHVLSSLLAMGTMLLMQKELEEVTPLIEEADELTTKHLAVARERRATTLKYLGAVYMQQKRLDEALGVFEQAVELSEAAAGPDHPETAKHLGNLASIHIAREEPAEARTLLDRALTIWSQQPEPNPVYTVGAMSTLAGLYLDEGKHVEALTLYRQGVEIQEAAFGSDNPRRLNQLQNYARALKKTGEVDEAARVEATIARIEKIAGAPADPG